MQSESQIVDELINIFVNLLKKDRSEIDQQIKPTATLNGDLGIDSAESFDLIFALEDHYSIKIEDHEADHLKTVQDVINLVLKKTV